MSRGPILVIEDEQDLRDIYAMILEHHGYRVCLSANGQEGLKQVNECEPSLVLLDIYMPVMDGKKFLLELDLSEHPGMKVVVCSNTSDAVLLGEMLELGADQVVTKSSLGPSDLARLVEPYMAV